MSLHVTSGEAQSQKLTYQQCLDLETELARLDGDIEYLERQVAEGGPPARVEPLRSDLNAKRAQNADAERRRRAGCGLTTAPGPLESVGGSGGSLPGANAGASTDNSARCGEIKPVLDRLRTGLPDIQRRMSNIQAQLDSRLASPAPGDRPALEAEFKRLAGEEDYSLTQISILKERLMGLGCDPDTGKADPKIPDLLKDIERAPDTSSPPSVESGREAGEICSRLPAEVLQVFSARPGNTGAANERNKCVLIQPGSNDRGYFNRNVLTILAESSDTAARITLRGMRQDDQPVNIGDEGYAGYRHVRFVRGRFVVYIESSFSREDQNRAVSEARRLDEIIGRW